MQKLKQKRIDKHLTQEDIAKGLKIEKSTYSRKENGILPITIEEANIISKLLSLSDREKIDIFLSL